MVRTRSLAVAGAAALVAVVAVGATAVSTLRRARADDARRDERTFGVDRANVVAPPVTVQTSDGRPLALSDLRGKVVFVNFWATWCPPCRDEMPSMLELGRELAARYPDRFRMVAVSVDEGWGDVRQFFRDRLPAEATVTLDPDQVATRAYYCVARGGCPDSFKFPETYIVAPDGRLVAYVVGPRNWSDPVARRVLERIIEG